MQSLCYKAGIIGLGQIGSLFDDDFKRREVWTHAGAYRLAKNVELVSGVDPDGNKRERFIKKWKVDNAYASSKEMFEKHKLDIVSICCPTQYHYQEAILAIKNGIKALFIEKPITARVSEAEEIIQLCKKKKIVLAVGHIRRYDPHYIFAKKKLENAEIGKVISIVGYYSAHIYMIGTHLIDTMRYYCGDIEKVMGEYVNNDRKDPTVAGYLHFSNGAMGFIVPQGKERNLFLRSILLGRWDG